MKIKQHRNRILTENIKYLEEKNFFKLICGASLTDYNVVRDLTYLFALAGANMIDIATHKATVDAAKAGIELAQKKYDLYPEKYPYFNVPIIMLSINAAEDPHFKTATIKYDHCNNCKICIEACEFNSIFYSYKDQKILINNDLCYGCGKCIQSCPNLSIYLENNTTDIESILTKLIDDSINGIEIHVGNSSEENLVQFWEKLKNILGNDCEDRLLFSFSLESSFYTGKQFVEYAKNITNLITKVAIIQVDGTPMSGNQNPAASLQSLAAAQVLLRNNIEAYIMLAGGVNYLTQPLIDTLELPCHGIGMGTYARKLLWPYIGKLDNTEILNKAIRITTNLVKGLEF